MSANSTENPQIVKRETNNDDDDGSAMQQDIATNSAVTTATVGAQSSSDSAAETAAASSAADAADAFDAVLKTDDDGKVYLVFTEKTDEDKKKIFLVVDEKIEKEVDGKKEVETIEKKVEVPHTIANSKLFYLFPRFLMLYF